MKINPPKYPLRFFRWFCHPKLRDSIEGDLMELYDERVKEIGKKKADQKFIGDVLLLFRPSIIRPTEGFKKLNTYGMYKNYLKTGWRNLTNNITFSFINISGLSLGLICSILIALWIYNEYTIDAFHEKIDRIYVVTSREFSGSEINGSYDTPGMLGEEMAVVLPEVEYSSNFAWTGYNTFSVGEKKMKIPGNFAGKDFFKIFSYPLLLGTPESALQNPDAIAISRKMATNLFGSPASAMDQTVRFENYKDLKVTAVFDDLKDNASEKFEYLISWQFFVERNSWVKDWGNSGPYTFALLHENADVNALSKKLQHFIKNYDEGYSDLDRLELGLQPFGDKYLNSNFKNGYVSGGRIEYVRLFKVVAIFILLIACINFMNLSTARSIKRAKEIGVRKVIGAVRGSLIRQFMVEAFLLTLIAVVLSIVLLTLLLPGFNLLTGKHILSPLTIPQFWLGLIVLTLLTGIVSGSYPALLLSSFKPIATLKNYTRGNASSRIFRKGLVVFQFALSMIFIVGMIIISNQVDYIHHKNLGYQKENLIYLSTTGNIEENFNLFKQQVLEMEGIVNVSHMTQRAVQIENSTGSVEWENKDPNTRPTFTQVAVSYDFIKTMKASLLYGRDFSEDHADSANYIINEAALKIIGYEDPIGMPLTFWDVKGSIIGVVKDFHFNSLHVPIAPLVIRLHKGKSWGVALIRFEADKTQKVVAGLENWYKTFNPDFVFAHQFADEEYNYLYKSEQVIQKLSAYFAFLAIFISCLGLLGLVIFTAEQRTKEVGIRKVLGATVSQTVTLLSKDFMKLVLLAIVVACPVAYYTMSTWLEGFEYHVDIQWWMFGLAAIGAVVIAMLTISFQAIKSSTANPVESLKAE